VGNGRPAAGRRKRGRLRRLVLLGALLPLAGPPALILAFHVLPPPVTPLMVIRLAEGHSLRRDWVACEAIAPALAEAVIASEDNLFCRQVLGFDFGALREQIEAWREGERPRGASTITMQTAKNLFLWPGRDPVRKLLEAWLTPQVALLWPRRRVLEVYLKSSSSAPASTAPRRRRRPISASRRPTSRRRRRRGSPPCCLTRSNGPPRGPVRGCSGARPSSSGGSRRSGRCSTASDDRRGAAGAPAARRAGRALCGYSTLTPAARTTGLHFSMSRTTMAANSSGVFPTGSAPSWMILSRISAVRSAATVSRWRRSTIGRGVPAGANRPNQATTS
jgi:hypothetical protein